jgi:hypothetical protein
MGGLQIREWSMRFPNVNARMVSVYFNSPEEQISELHLHGFVSGGSVFFLAAEAKKLFCLNRSLARLSGFRPGNSGR